MTSVPHAVRPLFLAILLALSLVAKPAFAQTTDFDQALSDYKGALQTKDRTRLTAAEERLCKAAAATDVPAEDKAPSSKSADMTNCQSDALYYDYQGSGANYPRARQCAIEELARPQNPDGTDRSPLQGPSVLMMVYANGQGVARNWPLAFRFTCDLGGAPAELSGRLEHLSKMTQETNPKPIDLCDDITSGYMMGFCAVIDNKRASFRREAELEKLLENSPQPVLAKYKVLKEQTAKFIDSQSTEEVDLGGTGRGAFSLSQEDADWEEFMAIMRSLTAKNGSSTASVDPKEEDRKLNDLYRKVMAAPGLKPTAEDAERSQDFGTVTTDGIRTTQRKWIAYRDAWVDFARALDPGSEDAVLAVVTANREKQLDLILNPDGG